MTKRIVFMGDLHCGSIHGLSPLEIIEHPDDVVTRKVVPCNKIQKFFFKNWETVIDTVGPVDQIVANGDLCEGINYKGQGEGCSTLDRSLQTDMAAEMIDMWKAPKVTVVDGTGYHTGTNPSLDGLVSEKVRNGNYAGKDLWLDVNKFRIHVAHKIGVCGADKKGRFTAIAREMQSAMLNVQYYGKCDMIVRSHVHYHVYAGMENMLGMTLPAWKCRDDYAKSNSLNWVPHHGIVLVEINSYGEMSWSQQMFELPAECKPKDQSI